MSGAKIQDCKDKQRLENNVDKTMKAVTSKQMSKIDEFMIKNGIELVMMMENAGLSLAMLAAKINKYKKNRKIQLFFDYSTIYFF